MTELTSYVVSRFSTSSISFDLGGRHLHIPDLQRDIMAAVLVALLLFFKPIQAYVLPRSAKSLIQASEKSILTNSALYLISNERSPVEISSQSRWLRSRWALGLDLQDILEDEVDFLQQLRKQMQSPLNASPREVTNRIKTFFASGRRSPEEIEAFKSYL